MTRFQMEISGALGEGWLNSAKKELEKIQQEFNRGEITVDTDGVLRNRIGRVAVEEVCEKCQYLGIKFDVKATKEARDLEAAIAIAQYKEAQKNRQRTAEEIHQMRAVFGEGATVVDIITGEKFKL